MTPARTVSLFVLLFLSIGCGEVVITGPLPPVEYPPTPPGQEGPSVEYEPSGLFPVALHVPEGQLPPPGACRIWYPDRPPGQQPPPGDCADLRARVPLGAWLIHRPGRDEQHVHVSVYDRSRPGVVIIIRVFEVATGRFVEERHP